MSTHKTCIHKKQIQINCTSNISTYVQPQWPLRCLKCCNLLFAFACCLALRVALKSHATVVPTNGTDGWLGGGNLAEAAGFLQRKTGMAQQKLRPSSCSRSKLFLAFIKLSCFCHSFGNMHMYELYCEGHFTCCTSAGDYYAEYNFVLGLVTSCHLVICAKCTYAIHFFLPNVVAQRQILPMIYAGQRANKEKKGDIQTFLSAIDQPLDKFNNLLHLPKISSSMF